MTGRRENQKTTRACAAGCLALARRESHLLCHLVFQSWSCHVAQNSHAATTDADVFLSQTAAFGTTASTRNPRRNALTRQHADVHPRALMASRQHRQISMQLMDKIHTRYLDTCALLTMQYSVDSANTPKYTQPLVSFNTPVSSNRGPAKPGLP